MKNKTFSFFLASLYAWAFFSFSSNSALALYHVLIFSTFFFALFKKQKLDFSISSKFLLVFIVAAIISLLLNRNEINDLWGKIFKLKYFLSGVAIYSLSTFFREKLKPHLSGVLCLFLLSFFIAVSYGLYGCYLDSEYRPTGLFGMIMSYAYSAQIPFLLLAFLAIHPEVLFFSDRKSTRFIQLVNNVYFRWAVLAVSAFNLYLSQARGAILGILIALPFLFFWKSKKLFVASISLSGIFIAFLAINALNPRNTYVLTPTTEHSNRLFLSSKAVSNEERLAQYKMAFSAFRESPLWGLGWRSLEERDHLIKAKYNIEFPQNSGHAHNIFLEVLGSMGIFGLLAFLGWIFTWFRESTLQNKTPWRAYYCSIIFAFLISGLFQSTIIDSEFCFTLFTLYGLSPLFTQKESKRV